METMEDIDLFDASRERPVPVRLWHPSGATRGWIIFSVGFGGDRSGYAFLARAWAVHGLATAVVEHIGSNLHILKGLPGRSRQQRNLEVVKRVSDPLELAARPRDLLHVYAHLQRRYSDLPLGIGGHSFGAYTVLAALGLDTVPKLEPLETAMPGPSSCLVISPQPPGTLFTPRSLAQVQVPTLVLTGTKDTPLQGEGDFRDRRAVFEHLPLGLRNLAVLDGVEHMAFAGVGLNLAPVLRALEGVTGQWWESTLFQREATPAQRAAALHAAAGDVIAGEYG